MSQICKFQCIGKDVSVWIENDEESFHALVHWMFRTATLIPVSFNGSEV